MNGYVAGVAFIVGGVLVYAIALRAARTAPVEFERLSEDFEIGPPRWVNDPTPDPEWWTRDLERRTS